MWVGGGWGVLHTCGHACACTHAHARHACMVNMVISCKWPPPLGKSLGIPYDVMCTCMCMCIHVHMGGVHPLTTLHPHPPTPPTPQGGPPESFKIQYHLN